MELAFTEEFWIKLSMYMTTVIFLDTAINVTALFTEL
jgi:hypothetical protein